MNNLVIDLFNKKIIYKKNTSIKLNYECLLSHPYLINNSVKFIYDKIKLLDYTHIIGIPGISSHISSILSYNHNIPLLIFNKDYVKGIKELNSKVILIIDTIDIGKHVSNYIHKLESNKIKIINILSLYKTNNNTIPFINNYKLVSLLTENNINKILSENININTYNYIKSKTINKINYLIKTKSSKLICECNLTNIKDIITKVDNIGKYIIALKICSNKIDNFCGNYGNALHKLSISHNFIIIDDIGVCNLKHINIENYKWCDVLTSYHNINIDFNLLYISNSVSDNNIILNKNFIGILGSFNHNYINISNTIYKTDELKNIILDNYDLVTLSSNLFEDKIIKYINSRLKND
tara:strand:- start:1718 stop:2776 length:1059 start_codon:yes stop_codon:yes gene_type:complete